MAAPSAPTGTLNLKDHVRYFLKCLEGLPAPYGSLDTSRMTVAYFCVSGLDILGALDKLDKAPIIDWVYAQQLRAPVDAPADWAGGFRGSGFLGTAFDPAGGLPSSPYDTGHIAMTYTALCILVILGDDLSRVDREATLRHVRQLQEPDGSFCACLGGENDMRFVYCAAAICTFLRDGADGEWAGLDAKATREYVLASQSYDGALGLGPGAESHGGSTYTGMAALSLLGSQHELRDRQSLIHWCLTRQMGGFQGRPNKDEDTCYSFWIGATLAMLGMSALIDAEALGCFAACCQGPKGGIAKQMGAHPDVLHSYFALAGMALVGTRGLRPIDARLGITCRARDSAGLHATASCGKLPSFIESNIPTRVEYEQWVASRRRPPPLDPLLEQVCMQMVECDPSE